MIMMIINSILMNLFRSVGAFASYGRDDNDLSAAVNNEVYFMSISLWIAPVHVCVDKYYILLPSPITKTNWTIFVLFITGEGKLRAASLRVVWLYSASHVQDKSQRPWKLGQEPKMNFS